MSLFLSASAVLVFCTVALGLAACRIPRPLQGPIFGAGLGITLAAAAIWNARLGTPPYALTDAAVLLGAALVAWIVGRSSPNLETLVLITAIAAVSDVVSSEIGATAKVIAAAHHGSPWLRYLSFSIPYHGAVQPVVGAGDLAFLGAAYYHAPRPSEPFFALRILLPLLALETALWLALTLINLPAIPYLAAALAASLWLRRRPQGHLRGVLSAGRRA